MAKSLILLLLFLLPPFPFFHVYMGGMYVCTCMFSNVSGCTYVQDRSIKPRAHGCSLASQLAPGFPHLCLPRLELQAATTTATLH